MLDSQPQGCQSELAMLIQRLAPDASFSVVLVWSSQVAPGAVRLDPEDYQEARGSLELHDGGLRTLKEVWTTNFLG